jgi:hypothetical protein
MTGTRRNPAESAEPASEPLVPSAVDGGSPNEGASLPIPPPAAGEPPTAAREPSVDLAQRRDELTARFAELQCDLGGLTYEMAIRNHIRVDVLVRKAAILQDVDAELGEVERILRLEETGTAGSCASCGAPHSSGAVYCWQCGQPLLEHVSSDTIST